MCKVLLPSFQNFDGENVSNFQRQGGRKTVESEKVYFNRNSKNSFYNSCNVNSSNDGSKIACSIKIYKIIN